MYIIYSILRKEIVLSYMDEKENVDYFFDDILFFNCLIYTCKKNIFN